MEPVGFAFAVVGLAGLFSTCLDCFHLVQTGCYLGRDSLILETKYSNQRLRLSAWGRACGFLDDNDSSGCGPQLQWSEEIQSAVSDTLRRIAALFQDHQTLSRRYGLSFDAPDATRSLMRVPIPLGSLARRLHARAVKRPVTGVQAAVQWAIVDKDKFSDLVTHLKDFIDDLEDLTFNTTVPRRQRRFIQVEVESICEESELETIEQARMTGRDPVADAASLRLSQLHETVRVVPSELAADVSVDWHVIDPVAAPPQLATDSCDSQILHRVSCNLEQTTLYLDKPSYKTATRAENQWLVVDTSCPQRTPVALHLSGTRPLHDLDSYLKQNTQLWWLVIKEYTCCHDTRENRDTEPLTTSILLISQKLCDDLNAFDRHHGFAPGRELKPPHDWLYHNCRNNLDRLFPREDSSPASERLLRFIEEDMAETYEEVSRWAEYSSLCEISWELLPLIFKPGKDVIEKRPDGYDDFRAYQQDRKLSRIVSASGQVSDEVLEIPVTDPFSKQASTLRVPRSVFEDAKRRRKCLSDLPILPMDLEPSCNKGYLYNRGCKFDILRHQPQVVVNRDDAGKMIGHYFVDISAYNRLGTNREMAQYPAARLESHHNPPSWLTVDGLKGDEYCESWSSNEDEDPFMKLDREYRNTLCAPHAVHGFHLVDHVWRKLLLRNTQLASDVAVDLSPEDLQTDSHPMVQFQELLAPMRRSEWGATFHQLKHLRKVVVSLQGPYWEAGVTLASRMTRRALYRIRLTGQTENLDGIFETAKTLNENEMWGCIVVVEDIVEATPTRSTLSENAAIIRSVLLFLDSYNGIVIFAVPVGYRIDPVLAQRVSMNFVFKREDLILNNSCRQRLWNRRIGDRFPSSVVEDDKQNLLETAAWLASWEVTEDEIQSVLDIVLAPGRNNDKPDWEALKQLLHHRLSLHPFAMQTGLP